MVVGSLRGPGAPICASAVVAAGSLAGAELANTDGTYLKSPFRSIAPTAERASTPP
jgi:hypothetical protein